MHDSLREIFWDFPRFCEISWLAGKRDWIRIICFAQIQFDSLQCYYFVKYYLNDVVRVFSDNVIFLVIITFVILLVFSGNSSFFPPKYNFWKMEKFLVGESSVKALKAFVGAFVWWKFFFFDNVMTFLYFRGNQSCLIFFMMKRLNIIVFRFWERFERKNYCPFLAEECWPSVFEDARLLIRLVNTTHQFLDE